jgi:hypothetical protein
VIPTSNQDGRQAKNRKKGMKFEKKSSSLKLLSQSQPNFAEMILAFLLSKWFQTRRFLWEFPIGSYVKLRSAVAAILVGGLKCRTHSRKGTSQGSFQQSLVEIGSVVSEEKIFVIQKCVRRFGPSTKMAPTAELSLT